MATVYWFNDGADSDWETLTGNWWDDALHTVQAAGLPTGTDDVVTVGDPGTGPEVDLDTWSAPVSIDATATGISFTSAVPGTVIGINVTGNVTLNGNAETQITTITGNAIANDDAKIGGPVTGTATVNDDACVDTAGTIVGVTTFNDSGHNLGLCQGGAVFNDTSYNDNVVETSAVFNDWSYNAENGVLDCDVILHNQAQNRAGISGSVTFPGYGINGSAILGMP